MASAVASDTDGKQMSFDHNNQVKQPADEKINLVADKIMNSSALKVSISNSELVSRLRIN